MAKITAEMKELVQRMRLCFAATTDSEGKPNLSPKGTLVVLDDEHLAFYDIDSPHTIRNLRSNSHIEINVVDPVLRKGYRFKGRVELLHEGPIFDQVAGGLWEREGEAIPGEHSGEDQSTDGCASAVPGLHLRFGHQRGPGERGLDGAVRVRGRTIGRHESSG